MCPILAQAQTVLQLHDRDLTIVYRQQFMVQHIASMQYAVASGKQHYLLVWPGRYQHYLESVLEGADEFHEVGDLMLRHATLAATNQDLKEQRNHFGEAAEQTR